MTSLSKLKHEVEMLNRVLTPNVEWKKDNLKVEKLLYLSDKVIEFSRLASQPDPLKLAVLYSEINDFNAEYPLSSDDLIKLQPYLAVIEEAESAT